MEILGSIVQAVAVLVVNLRPIGTEVFMLCATTQSVHVVPHRVHSWGFPVGSTGYHAHSQNHDKPLLPLVESKVEMKKRGLDSPDDADALALTFARPVAHRKLELPARPEYWYPGQDNTRWMM